MRFHRTLIRHQVINVYRHRIPSRHASPVRQDILRANNRIRQVFNKHVIRTMLFRNYGGYLVNHRTFYQLAKKRRALNLFRHLLRHPIIIYPMDRNNDLIRHFLRRRRQAIMNRQRVNRKYPVTAIPPPQASARNRENTYRRKKRDVKTRNRCQRSLYHVLTNGRLSSSNLAPFLNYNYRRMTTRQRPKRSHVSRLLAFGRIPTARALHRPGTNNVATNDDQAICNGNAMISIKDVNLPTRANIVPRSVTKVFRRAIVKRRIKRVRHDANLKGVNLPDHVRHIGNDVRLINNSNFKGDNRHFHRGNVNTAFHLRMNLMALVRNFVMNVV